MSNGDEYIEDEEEFVDELKPGTELMLGQYKIDSFLAAGGFGITYLAKDSLDRFVVIKECFPGSFCRRQNHSVLPRSRAHQNELKSIVRMFSQEAMSLSKAGHPNVVGVHQVFEENNTAYMALDYVKGSDLLEILTDNPESLTPELVQGYLTKMLSAIGHVHRQGILHRDISPDNIIISSEGEPVLIDFGAAREEAGGKASRMLSALRVVKDGYSPQEFYIAGSEQSPSCDLYSLAASFYHIITGNLPPDSQTRLTTFAAHEPDPYVPLATIGKGYPKEFCAALDKAMSVLPKDRMQSADDWLAHLAGEAPVKERNTASNKDTAPTASKKAGKSLMPLLLGGAAAAAAAGVGFVVMSTPGENSAGEKLAEVSAPSAPANSVTEPEEQVVEAEAEAVAPVEASEDVAEVTEIPAEPAAEAVEEVQEIAQAPAVDPVPPMIDTAEELAVATPEPEPELDAEAGEDGIAAANEPPAIEEEAAVIASVVDEPVEIEPIAALSLPSTPPAPRPAVPGPSNIVAYTEAVVLAADAISPIQPPVAPAIAPSGAIPRDLIQLASATPDLMPEIDLMAPAALPEPEPEVETVEPEVAEAASVDAGSVVTADSNWSVRMPFAASKTNASVVGEVYLSAWGWLQEGTEISGVNGISISDIDMIPGVLRQSSVLNDRTQLDVMLTTGFERGGKPVEHQIILPVVQETVLNSGIRFETVFRNGVWQTSVAEIGNAETTLQPGDIVIEHLATQTQMTGRTSLADAIADANSSELPLLVSRDGEVIEAGVFTKAPEVAVVEDAPVVEPAVVGVVEASSVMERQVNGVPFTLSRSEPKTVATVSENAPFWVVPGLEIATINGTVVNSNAEIMSLINSASGSTVQIGVEALFTSALIERPLRVGAETQTVLLNGLTFSTRVVDNETVTHVVDAPAGSNFQIGDKLVAYVGTSERLDGTISIKALLERELAAGKTSFSFAVDRAGEVWVEAFKLASLEE